MHAAGVTELCPPLAIGDLVAEIRQRNARAKLLDQIFLPVLPGTPAFFARELHHVGGMVA